MSFDLPEKPVPPDRQSRARFNAVDAYTFETMGIPLLRGRAFDARDT